MPKLPIKKLIGDRQERCLYCSGTKIIKKRKRRKKFETVQLWYCKDCDTVFAPRTLKGKTYPIPVILVGLGYYHTGQTQRRKPLGNLDRPTEITLQRQPARRAARVFRPWDYPPYGH